MEKQKGCLKKNQARPTKIEYYLGIAEAVSKRATCLRRSFGAVIVKNDQIISTGYCGSPRGATNCIDLGKCLREEQKIPSGERYELCRSVHAEMNAIIHASREQLLGSTLYLYGENVKTGEVAVARPCQLCRRMIINAGIEKVAIKTNEGFQEFNVSDWVDEEPNPHGY